VAQITVLKDQETLSAAAADRFTALARAALESRDRMVVCLAGGKTPRRLYELLADPASPWRTRIEWSRVHVFWGAGRYVPAGDPESNYRMARETLLDHVPCPAENIHAMPTHISPAATAAATYDQVLKDYFREGNGPAFDLNILGIGADAHTASVFPASPAVDERERWVMDVQTSAAIPTRLTLTLPAISRSANIHVLVAGAGKATALRQALAADADPHRYPASGIRRGRGVVWWVDRAAAS